MELRTLSDYTTESIRAAYEDLSPEWQSSIERNMQEGEIHMRAMNRVFKLVDDERKAGKVIFPRFIDTFRALKLVKNSMSVKVIILGQDPYHGPGQANGLSFSVNKGQPIPPSLRNIFLELKSDLGIEPPNHGDLTEWAQKGVLLLNTTLTVEQGKPMSHGNFGWEVITESIIRSCRRGVVGILWGKHAQKFKHCFAAGQVICSPHPSPFSADSGFFGSKPFSKANAILHYTGPIDWSLK